VREKGEGLRVREMGMVKVWEKRGVLRVGKGVVKSGGKGWKKGTTFILPPFLRTFLSPLTIPFSPHS
jgi:hypothetical protein